MKPWAVWTWRFPDAGEHPAVVLGTDERVRLKPRVCVILCSTQRAARRPEVHEVILDGADGLDWETLCKCDLVYAAAQDRTHQTPRQCHSGTPARDCRAGYPRSWPRGALAHRVGQFGTLTAKRGKSPPYDDSAGNTLRLDAKSKTDQPHHSASAFSRRYGGTRRSQRGNLAPDYDGSAGETPKALRRQCRNKVRWELNP